MEILINDDKNLRVIPVDIDQYFQITAIKLSNCSITKIPNEIYNLQKLTCLSLTELEISLLPPGISKLTKLNSLKLCSTKITKIPCEVYSVCNLVNLDFIGCDIIALPPGISNLTNLKTLDVGNLVLNKSNIPYDIIPIIKNNDILIGHGKNMTWYKSMQMLKYIVDTS